MKVHLPTDGGSIQTACRECGMALHDEFEYHPFAACLMFKGCHDASVVLANLNAVLAHGYQMAVDKGNMRND